MIQWNRRAVVAVAYWAPSSPNVGSVSPLKFKGHRSKAGQGTKNIKRRWEERRRPNFLSFDFSVCCSLLLPAADSSKWKFFCSRQEVSGVEGGGEGTKFLLGPTLKRKDFFSERNNLSFCAAFLPPSLLWLNTVDSDLLCYVDILGFPKHNVVYNRGAFAHFFSFSDILYIQCQYKQSLLYYSAHTGGVRESKKELFLIFFRRQK